MYKPTNKLVVGILGGIADLYHRLWTDDIGGKLDRFLSQVADAISQQGIIVHRAANVSTTQNAERALAELLTNDVDLIIVVLAPYCPSGILACVLERLDTPVVLWPAQTLKELVPAELTEEDIKFSHGVHAVQDLANVLRKRSAKFGILHGHHSQADTLNDLVEWAKAARIIQALKRSDPLQIGGHFDDMLDLQVGSDGFAQEVGLSCHSVTADEFADVLRTLDQAGLGELVAQYRDEFAIAPDVTDDMLLITAAGEKTLRLFIDKHRSKAFGINFQELCNHSGIGDPLHVCASRLMAEGRGYAGEGDWVTASFVYALQEAFEQASFTEMFTVGYNDNRLLLRHWGEGNCAMARAKPTIARSSLKDQRKADFLVVGFEFRPGPVTLLNLNSNPDGEGQLITVTGHITEDHVPRYSGPRGIFEPTARDVRAVLDEYAYAGGSHHLAMVGGNVNSVIERVARLTGWEHTAI